MNPFAVATSALGFGESLTSSANQRRAAKAAVREIDKALAQYPEAKELVEEMFEQRTDIIEQIKTLEEGKATFGYETDIEAIQRNFYDVAESARETLYSSGFASSGRVDEFFERQSQYMERDVGARQTQLGFTMQDIGIQGEEAMLGAEQERTDRLAAIESAIANLEIQRAQLSPHSGGFMQVQGGLGGTWMDKLNIGN